MCLIFKVLKISLNIKITGLYKPSIEQSLNTGQWCSWNDCAICINKNSMQLKKMLPSKVESCNSITESHWLVRTGLITGCSHAICSYVHSYNEIEKLHMQVLLNCLLCAIYSNSKKVDNCLICSYMCSYYW